jgi:predicted PurR-regulated permease PerM
MKQFYKLLAIVVGLILLWRLQFVFLIVLVSFMLTLILLPFVRLLHKYKLPALLAVFIPIIVFASILTGVGIYVAPSVSEQLPKFAREFPELVSRLTIVSELNLNTDDLLQVVRNRSADIGSLAYTVGLSLLQAFGVILTVIVLTIYWLRGYDTIKSTLISYVPKKNQLQAEDIWLRAEVKLGRWFLGQIFISSAVGVAVWLTALSLGLPFAGVLGIIAALLEIIPLIGPILASVPAILFGLSDSFEKGLIVALAYIIIQQLESQLLSPLIMGRAVHLHPIVIIVSFLIGTILYGLIGGLLAVPTALLASAFVDSYRGEKLNNQNLP